MQLVLDLIFTPLPLAEEGGGLARRVGAGPPLRASFALLLTGCGNQMYRQPSLYTAGHAPRCPAPGLGHGERWRILPTDARPVASTAYGAQVKLPGEKDPQYTGGVRLTQFPSKEPTLPPPNLSDNARYEPAPASVDALANPLPNDPRVVRSGQILFYNRCVQCHNPGGYGYGTVGQYLVPHPPDLAAPLVQHITDGAMFWHITMGQGKMPGFRHWLTPNERWATDGVCPQPERQQRCRRPGQRRGVDGDARRALPDLRRDGFQDGRSAYPFKVLNPPTGDPDSRETVHSQGFGQPPPPQSR